MREGNNQGVVMLQNEGNSVCSVGATKNEEGEEVAGGGDACRLLLNYINSHNATIDEFVDPDGSGYGITITGYSDDYAPGGNNVKKNQSYSLHR